MMRHAAVWMGFACAADVIANGPGRGARDGVDKEGMEGRDGPNGRERCLVMRLSRLSMKIEV